MDKSFSDDTHALMIFSNPQTLVNPLFPFPSTRQYKENRQKMVDSIRAAGGEAYPHKWPVNAAVPTLIAENEGLENGARLENDVVIAGRIRSKREASQKMIFYDLVADGAKIQVMATFQDHDAATGDFAEIHHNLHRGDIVGVRGPVGRSQRGEFSVRRAEWGGKEEGQGGS